MTLDLDAIQARADAATQGPWFVAEEIDGMRAGRETVVRAAAVDPADEAYWKWNLRVVTVGQTRQHCEPAEPNVQFIAHARQDIPDLIARIRELETEVHELMDEAGNL